ncbi:hypothetical protein FOA43_003396 [Brettanomyces nanus]|uniref:Vps41 beta-propeller domain-containing protein n=1 Tax=Eeniella nana TaxID=13502 RepID=A0A875RQ67_EENNA|nr:uncharacterized protein FOA43_003396 [Brettanomyces nanus]QPG76010.1 hypothetical protein FOA43_003396 [Brettanomyces nanus]
MGQSEEQVGLEVTAKSETSNADAHFADVADAADDLEDLSVKYDSTPEKNEENEKNEPEDEEGKVSDITSVESGEDSPPRLKYTRLTKLPPRFFDKDPVSACIFNEKVFIFASHSGLIHLCRPDFKPIRTFKGHMTSILSVDTDGTYFASGSMDGTVLIGSIEDETDITRFDFKRPIYSVALHRSYKSTKAFLSGGTGGKLVYSMRSWLGQRQDTVLGEGNGPITMIKAVDDIVFWSNDAGLHVTQLNTQKSLIDVTLPPDFPRAEMYWPRFHLIDSTRVLIGWVNHIWLFIIQNPHSMHNATSKILSSAASSFISGGMEEKQVEIERHAILDDDMLISGISEFNDNLLILNYIAPEPTKDPKTGRKVLSSHPPELIIINRVTLEEESVDVVALNSYSGLGFNDYHLHQYISPSKEARWYLISANDGVVVQEFGLQDKLAWYKAKGWYLEAWSMSAQWLDKTDRLNIAMKQVNKFVSHDQWREAAEFMGNALKTEVELDTKEYCGHVSEEWNNWLQNFVDAGHLEVISDQLPSEAMNVTDSGISSKYYNLSLNHFLDSGDYATVSELILKWDHKLFDLDDITYRIGEKLKEYDDAGPIDDDDNSSDALRQLRRLYVDLCVEQDRPEICIDHLIRLEDPDLLQFLDEHHLIGQNLEKLPTIMRISGEKRDMTCKDIEKLRKELAVNISILVENSHELLPADIIKVMDDAGMDYISYLYLERLSKVESLLVECLEDEMVELYASYNKAMLSGFLNKHKNYSIEKAIAVCERMHCIPELAFLLSKVGENKKALTLIIDELDNPQMAIQFTESVNDKDLWDYLLDYSMDRPDFVRALMENAGDTIDPLPVVNRIPEGVEIKGLKEALVNITRNMELDDSIYKLILQIIWKEVVDASHEYRGLRLEGYSHEPLNNRIRASMETLIKIPLNSNAKASLVTERELLGENYVWKGESKAPTEKIKHVSYIKGWLMRRKNEGKSFGV